MHIEIHHSHFSPILGGQERRIHALVGELLRQGHDVTVVAPAAGVDDARPYTSRGMRVITHEAFFSRRPFSVLDHLLNVRRLTRFHRNRPGSPAPELIVAFNHLYALSARQAFPSSRIVYLAGATAWDWHSSLYGHRSKLSRACLTIRRVASMVVEKCALRAMDRIFFVSSFL
jgi:glycosyltransferase involved in cell wall biosynthesis